MYKSIDNYRGYEVLFDTDNETFFCDIEDGKREKKSFSSIKMAIDAYIKLNAKFEPFVVIENVTHSGNRREYTITGIRKDNRFSIKNSIGEIRQISEYYEKDYSLKMPENEPILKELDEFYIQESKIKKQLENEKEEIINRLKVTTLRTIKSKYAVNQ